MNRFKTLFSILIVVSSITLSTTTLAEGNIVETNADEYSKGVGELRDGVLHVTAVEAAQLLDEKPDIKVLDVRTGFEYKRGHIEGAVQINYYFFGFEKKLSALDKETTWLVHCKSGVRSGNTLPLMKKLGFKSIIHMDDGINGWRAAKLPETKVK